jgi:uracil-DNA glycosylase
MNIAEKRDIFIKMNRAIVVCNKCRLCKSRTYAVPGEGNINAEVVFIGEAPGLNEDVQGRPFVGKSGMFLNEMLSRIQLKRTDVWIGNVVKCRPPENRDPMVDEVRACKPYLERQLSLINPRIIVTLGRFALEFFIPNAKISEVHGKPVRVKTYVIYPLYHPAAALRNPPIKKALELDFIGIKKVLDEEFASIPFAESLKGSDEEQLTLF